jgi:hypothetical protein
MRSSDGRWKWNCSSSKLRFSMEMELQQFEAAVLERDVIARADRDLDRVAVVDHIEGRRLVVEHDLLEVHLHAVAQVDRGLAVAITASGPFRLAAPVGRAGLALVRPVIAMIWFDDRLGRYGLRGGLLLARFGRFAGLGGSGGARLLVGAHGRQTYRDLGRQLGFGIGFGLGFLGGGGGRLPGGRRGIGRLDGWQDWLDRRHGRLGRGGRGLLGAGQGHG